MLRERHGPLVHGARAADALPLGAVIVGQDLGDGGCQRRLLSHHEDGAGHGGARGRAGAGRQEEEILAG